MSNDAPRSDSGRSQRRAQVVNSIPLTVSTSAGPAGSSHLSTTPSSSSSHRFSPYAPQPPSSFPPSRTVARASSLRRMSEATRDNRLSGAPSNTTPPPLFATYEPAPQPPLPVDPPSMARTSSGARLSPYISYEAAPPDTSSPPQQSSPRMPRTPKPKLIPLPDENWKPSYVPAEPPTRKAPGVIPTSPRSISTPSSTTLDSLVEWDDQTLVGTSPSRTDRPTHSRRPPILRQPRARAIDTPAVPASPVKSADDYLEGLDDQDDDDLMMDMDLFGN